MRVEREAGAEIHVGSAFSDALIDGHVILSNDAPSVHAAIAQRLRAGSLADDQDYRVSQAQLPHDTLGQVYIAPCLGREASHMFDSSAPGQGTAADVQAPGDPKHSKGLFDALDEKTVHDTIKNLNTFEGSLTAIVAGREGLSFRNTTRWNEQRFTPAFARQMQEQRIAFDPRTLRTVSRDAIMLWSWHLGEEFRTGMAQGLHDELDAEDLRALATRGIDLDRDLLSWIAGDGGLVLLSGDAPGQGLPLPLSAYAILNSSTPDAARAGVKRLTGQALKLIIGNQAALAPETIDGVHWQVYRAHGQRRAAFGYGIQGDTLLVGLGRHALESASDAPRASLVDDPTFQQATSRLPATTGGIFYLDVPRALACAREVFGRTEAARRRFDQGVLVQGLSTIRTISVGNQPGLVKGIGRSVYFVGMNND